MTVALNCFKIAMLLLGALAVWAIAMPDDLPQALVDSSGSAVAAGFVEMVAVLALG